ncbi:PAN domain-containing protein [Dichotomicrobium thermohalophilum]|uniref:PAN domain-containing protein n=1 Tax=Dichotomicrobium thermohalophilum TaxID=933063 RepID=UPI000E5A8413|nr:PAN domain-containing protein [Dichotomicrobium thermohalophilum]
MTVAAKSAVTRMPQTKWEKRKGGEDMRKGRNLTVSAISGVALALASMLPASAAEPTCPPKIVSPSGGSTISLTPTIKFEPTGRNCNPNWKVIEIYFIDTDTKQVIYSRENDRGASRGYSSNMLPFTHRVPKGHLRRGERYEIGIAVTIPKIFRPNWETEREFVTVSTKGRTGGGQDNSVSWEPGIDRPGSDYRNFTLASDQPGLCARQCEQERR